MQNQQREITALDRQGTQQQRPKSLTATQPIVQVNSRGRMNEERITFKPDGP